MWWEIMQALNTYLTAYFADNTDLRPAIVNGACAGVPEALTIELLRGPGTADDKLRNRRGQQTIYVDCWAYDAEDKPEKNTAYAQLQALEQHMQAAIARFGHGTDTVDGLHIVVKPQATQPDGDVFRPSVGSRTPLDIQWTRIQ